MHAEIYKAYSLQELEKFLNSMKWIFLEVNMSLDHNLKSTSAIFLRLIWNFVISLLISSHSRSALTIPWGQWRSFRMSPLRCTLTWFPESGLMFILDMLTNFDFLGKANCKNCRRQWASLNILLVCSNCFTFTVGSRRSRIDFNALAAFTYSWQVKFFFFVIFSLLYSTTHCVSRKNNLTINASSWGESYPLALLLICVYCNNIWVLLPWTKTSPCRALGEKYGIRGLSCLSRA